MNDGFYIIQGLYCDGRVCEEDSHDDHDVALEIAHIMRTDPCFEGSEVRVLTRDGEVVQS